MEYFIGQIELFGFNFDQAGWIRCFGQTLPIANYSALYSLIGTTFGGDGNTTFMLPSLQDASPMPQMVYYIATEGIYPERS